MTQTSPTQQAEQYTIHLEDEERLILPQSVRQRLGLKQGDRTLSMWEFWSAIANKSAKIINTQLLWKIKVTKQMKNIFFNYA